jgi:hypothetical protein
MANQQTLEILLKIKADTDAALKQLASQTKAAGDSAKRMGEDASKALLKMQADALRMNATFDKSAAAIDKMRDQALRMNAAFDKKALLNAQAEAIKMNQSFDKAAESAKGLGVAMALAGGAAAVAGLAALASVVVTIGKVSFDAAMAAAAYGDKIVDLADKTDLSTKSLQAFDIMARTGNTSVETISAGVLKMGRNIVAGADSFRRLGLDIEKLKAMSPEEQFKAVAVAIDGLGSNAEKSAARVDIFGKAGDQLTTVLREAATGATELGGALSDEALTASAELQDQADLLKAAWERVGLQFGAAIAQSPELRRGIEDITQSIVSLAETVGKATPQIVEFFNRFTESMRGTIAAAAAGGGFLSDIFSGKSAAVAAANAAGQFHAAAYADSYKQTLAKFRQELALDTPPPKPPPGGYGPSKDDIAKAAAANQKIVDERRKAIEAENKLNEKAALGWDAFFKTIEREGASLTKAVEADAKAREKAIVAGLLAEMLATREAAADRVKSYEEMSEHMLDAVDRVRREGFDGLADGLAEAAGLLEAFGVSADSALGGIVNLAAGTADMIANAAKNGGLSIADLANQLSNIYKQASVGAGALSGAMTGFAIGGPIGAGIGGLIGGLTGLFGKAKAAEEALKKMRAEFLASVGGMDALKAKAAEAGVSLDKLFKAKSADQLKKAIAQIKGELDTWTSSHDRLNKAVEKYGFTLEELGPKFQAQQLDAMAQDLLTDWTLLVASGIDVVNVATRMADSLNDMAAKARATGQSLPENLRPIYEELLRQGKLVDENGNAYGSLEEAGLSFTQSLTDGMKELVEEIKRMVAAITGVRIPPIRIGVEYDDPGYGGGGGGGGGHHAPQNEFPGNATGGFYDRPQLAWMAEAGPARQQGEFAIPREMLQSMLNQAARSGRDGGSNGRGTHVVVNVGGRQVWQEFSNATRRGQARVHPNATAGGSW